MSREVPSKMDLFRQVSLIRQCLELCRDLFEISESLVYSNVALLKRESGLALSESPQLGLSRQTHFRESKPDQVSLAISRIY